MENPKYILKKAADGQYFWERTAANGEGIAYSLPDRFTQKHTALQSIAADITSLLTILKCKEIKVKVLAAYIEVSYREQEHQIWPRIVSFDVEDKTK
jgi:uncharacterized protein YegP (UPF0339 family)